MLTKFSTVQFCQNLLKNAVEQRVSDLHIEPQSEVWRIRWRIDGILYLADTLSKTQADGLINHLKILAQMDIAETRLPQDGQFSFYLNNTLVKECRVSSCPSIYGEKLVIRLLENNQDLVSLDELGFSHEALMSFRNSLKKPQGLILVTGPTGSGKTLTLYHALSLLNKATHNIISIEDPVEIKVPGITQVNINRKIGFDFAHALRSFLRQDPDIIMLGEIRDSETAEMVIKAAQTGHLVLSSLHTNNAISSITRLANLGISHYNIADTLKLVIAQRLLRKLCLLCQGNTCAHCKEGYQGRIGVFEVLNINQKMVNAISQHVDQDQLLALAEDQGFENLQQAAHYKLQQGITNLAEIQRIIYA